MRRLAVESSPSYAACQVCKNSQFTPIRDYYDSAYCAWFKVMLPWHSKTLYQSPQDMLSEEPLPLSHGTQDGLVSQSHTSVAKINIKNGLYTLNKFHISLPAHVQRGDCSILLYRHMPRGEIAPYFFTGTCPEGRLLHTSLPAHAQR